MMIVKKRSFEGLVQRIGELGFGRIRRNLGRGAALLFVATGLGSPAMGEAFVSFEEASAYPSFPFQGEYLGEVEFQPGSEPVQVGLQVAAYGEREFRARLFSGGLPGDPSTGGAGERAVDLTGGYDNFVLEFRGAGALRLRYELNRFVAVDEENRVRGQLERVRRESPVLGLEAPENAVVLFDGTNLDHWKKGSAITEEGWLRHGATTAEKYGDFRLHLEAKHPFMPEEENQGRSNSGIYIQNRYEVQILDSFAVEAQFNGNTSLYRVVPPRINASYPPLTWQTYDVFFRTPRFGEDGTKTENARVTVYLNGVLVQDDVELEKGTGSGAEREEVSRAELYLQDHGNPVRFRNVWLIDGEYAPPGTAFLGNADGGE